MGNCITFQRVVSWVDDGEWDFIKSESPRHSTDSRKSQDEEPPTMAKSIDQDILMSSSYEGSSSVGTKPITKPTHEVRVKISKKKLTELLKQAESKGMPVQDVLASIIETGKPCVRHRIDQCWQPGLQSIPEIVE